MTDEDMDTLAALYIKVIESELGLKAVRADPRYVSFKHPDMGTFVVLLDKNDPEFMRMLFPNFADKDKFADGSADKLLALLNSVNMQNKAVKLTMDSDGDVSAMIECFVAGPDQIPSEQYLKAIMKRSFSALRAGVKSLTEAALKNSDAV